MENLIEKADIRILPDDILIPADAERTILAVLLKEKIAISHSCGGMGSCGTCRVHVEDGLLQLGQRGSVEAEIAAEYGYRDEERLACQNKACPGLTIRLPKNRSK